ncbi:hypothetical protein JKP88DRAFT_241235 [Tribonema minus]|uniref:Uncharacterized protein n=1 Tax=Tribonema minus TaxID=303371 RepID=A0A835YY97_9STRA|nr:hypothetical protein JKP88DRAFT_241235 [Tribonema minus]
MNVLTGTAPISGPHFIEEYVGGGGVHVFNIGEEHTNRNACWRDGHDIVDVMMACLDEGLCLYLEMPPRFETRRHASVECPSKPDDAPREDFLNDLRTCSVAALSKGLHVKFVDLREAAGPLPFTREEEEFVAREKQRTLQGDPGGAHRNITNRFHGGLIKVKTGVTAECDEFLSIINNQGRGDVDQYVCSEWKKRVTDLCNGVGDVLQLPFPQYVDESLKCYRAAMDDAMNLYCVWLIARHRAGKVRNPPPPAVFYGGSAHCIVLARDLKALGFRLVGGHAGSSAQSCIRRPR